ncbi:hypothetical protein [Actinoplanes siamensis]|uniref:Uncharacterized protein n=1 Tax=Actinoplanes siamensis TaxID=1223317 RepID=A0A919N9H6_9ACTN|nr:hypothetical protein [Actinoplanes siamensis]GIF06988.1 hypothetical protein Asi03nite_45260 [Actinoplanes siamensis]
MWARLAGQPLAGTSTMVWTGLLDRRTGELDAELLTAAGAHEWPHPDGVLSPHTAEDLSR